MQSCLSADEYMQKLPSFDQDWATQRHDAEAAGEVSKPFTFLNHPHVL
jgi:aspartokinase/homoserine dehydrogenase 1